MRKFLSVKFLSILIITFVSVLPIVTFSYFAQKSLQYFPRYFVILLQSFMYEYLVKWGPVAYFWGSSLLWLIGLVLLFVPSILWGGVYSAIFLKNQKTRHLAQDVFVEHESFIHMSICISALGQVLGVYLAG